MWLLDTNSLILCNRLKIKQFTKEIYTTILSLIEYPLGSNFENITLVFPSTLHYEQAFKNAIILREKGTPIPTIDLLIGTISVDKKLILVSDDNHFSYFQAADPRLKLISSKEFIQKIQ